MQALGGMMNQTAPFGGLGGNQQAPCCSLFVKGLAKGVTERQLHSIFSAFGSVIDCQVARHRSGRSAGFAVVTYFRREDAQRALLVMESAVLAGRRLNVRWYTPELQQSTMGMGDLNVAQALAAMLGGPKQQTQQQQAQQQVQQQIAAANATQMLVQQLASAVAASRQANGVGMPSANGPADWAALQATASPRMQQQNFANLAGSGAAEIACFKKQPMPNWLDNDASTTLHGQVDSWARHSIDTAAPNYAPRRRSSQNCSRLSLEGLDLSACSAATSNHEETASDGQPEESPIVMDIHLRESSKWSVPRSGSSADSSVPLSSPNDQSEDGSCGVGMLNPRPHHKRGGHMDAKHHLHHLNNDHGTTDMIREDFSETGANTNNNTNNINLPPTLDSDSLFERQPSLTASSVASLRSSASQITVNNNNNSNIKPKMSAMGNLPPSVFAMPGNNGPMNSPGGGGMRGGNPERPHMDLATALSLSALSLDSPSMNGGGGGGPMGRGGLNPSGSMPSQMQMEVAIQQAAQAEQMIAQLSAMRSQALMAYHAAAVLGQPPAPYPAQQGMHACMMGMNGNGQGQVNPGTIEAMLASGALSPSSLESLSALVLQQGMQAMY